ncbi:MAG TPA: complex I NDUFA9 subunit family protein [Gemmatimonadales bacterium]|nr:complex I NDUFA9 subunit family protein [Gemmatimonadales bacterium]
MRIAVTGGTGFVGSQVVELLLRRDHELSLLTRDPMRHGRLQDRGVRLVAGDLENPSALQQLTDGAEAVLHLVGIIVEVGRQTFERVHVDGTRRLIAAAQQAGVKRLVHMSALGARQSPEATRYHRTKFAAELLVKESGLSYAIIRPSLIAAPGNEVLGMMVTMLRMAPVVPVIGDGTYRMQPVAGSDVAEAIALALEEPRYSGTFELGGPEQLTYHQMLDQLENALGVRRARVSVPVPIVRFAAHAGMILPQMNPITPDQLQMLLEGNCTANNALCDVFGLRPVPFSEVARDICAPWAALRQDEVADSR